MPSIDRETIELWVQRVFELHARYIELTESGVVQKLGAPASDRDLNAFETFLGYSLPASYRMFLSLHNGWQCFEGDEHLLAIQQQMRGPYAEWIRTMKAEHWDEGREVILEGLIIGVELNSSSSLILDTRKRDKRGEMDVVNWEFAEVARYSDFLDMLKKQAVDLEELIEEEEGG
jgi:hypothetical protein